MADFEWVLRDAPENIPVRHQLANARRMAGQLGAALAEYDRLLELQPADAAAWMGRGLIHFQKLDHLAAIDDFTQAIARAPQLAVAYNNRGYNYQRLERWSEALADFHRATELAPKYGLAWQNKAWVRLLAEDGTVRDAAGALAAAQAACDLTAYGNVNDLIVLSAAYAAVKDFERAVQWQAKVVDLLPDDARQGAEKLLHAYQRREPFDPQMLQMLAPATADASATGAAAERSPAGPAATGSPAK
jgi:tetratricopeptide (TPR) repeat protein